MLFVLQQGYCSQHRLDIYLTYLLQVRETGDCACYFYYSSNIYQFWQEIFAHSVFRQIYEYFTLKRLVILGFVNATSLLLHTLSEDLSGNCGFLTLGG